MATKDSDLVVNADKEDLLARLKKSLAELEARIEKGMPAEVGAHRAYAKHVAAVLQKASDDVRAGRLVPTQGRPSWCHVRSEIEARVRAKEVPEGQKVLRDRAREFEQAIAQVEMHRRPYLLVSTSQWQKWFGKKGGRS